MIIVSVAFILVVAFIFAGAELAADLFRRKK
jgi:hypothetical protein